MTAYSQISANKTKTFAIMAMLIVFIAIVVYLFSVSLGLDHFNTLTLLGVGLILAGLANFGSYYFSDRIVIAVSRAQPVELKNFPDLYRIVENLSISRGLPVPKIYLIDDTAINAFATGRNPNHASIVVTRGAVERLSNLELEGVIAHELSHIANYDTLLLSVVSVLVGMVALIADIFIRMTLYGGIHNKREERSSGRGVLLIIALVLALLSPIIGTLINFAISRKREFLADASAVVLTRHPNGLADALEKIAKDTEVLEVANKATAHLYISNPLKNQKGVSLFANLFSTHPPIEERIAVLRSM